MTRNSRHAECDERVASAIDRLCDELVVVRQVLDAILDELQWSNRNRPVDDGPIPIYRRISSMPLGPTALDWAERLNRYSPADLPNGDDPASGCEPGRLF